MHRVAVFVLLILSSLGSTAQLDSLQRWRVTSELIQMFFLNFNAQIERNVGHGSHGLLLAYRPSMRSGGEVQGVQGQFGGYSLQNSWNWLYQSVSVGTTHKFWSGREDRYFFEVDLIYRHWWFDRKWASYPNDEGYRFDGLRSERQDVFAIKVLWGESSWLGRQRQGGRRYLLESFAGLGWRWKKQRYMTHTGAVYDEQRSDHVENYSNSIPSIHAGFRFGMAWGKPRALRSR